MVVKFLWPYNIFYSDGISLGLFWSSSRVLFYLPFFYSLNYLLTRRGFWWLNLLVPRSRAFFPSPRTESLMLVILTIFYFCSLYLRFNKNLPAIHCHFLSRWLPSLLAWLLVIVVTGGVQQRECVRFRGVLKLSLVLKMTFWWRTWSHVCLR